MHFFFERTRTGTDATKCRLGLGMMLFDEIVKGLETIILEGALENFLALRGGKGHAGVWELALVKGRPWLGGCEDLLFLFLLLCATAGRTSLHATARHGRRNRNRKRTDEKALLPTRTRKGHRTKSVDVYIERRERLLADISAGWKFVEMQKSNQCESSSVGKFVECGRLKRMSTRCVFTNKFESDR